MLTEAKLTNETGADRDVRLMHTPHALNNCLRTGLFTKSQVSELATFLVVQFRARSHLCNVLTHISGGRWDKVEEAFHQVLDPHTPKDQLTPLGVNIVDVLCKERGVTGRIAKPYFAQLIQQFLPTDDAVRIEEKIIKLSDGED
ncbi:hypothetical protein MXMO3_03533 (plasmid) [Maritalea myrionectae]|uniref:Uncharacterized protein n=1 Tax=Maritalea myrionectae TaxID=454601 RepID=A0A2R4MJE0_9HYPH|nr:hypothetical protein [Maritalea myrionectae]AVX06036.1 hypothetical protein MXMO3_03533 [Maritalea myrionectae]